MSENGLNRLTCNLKNQLLLDIDSHLFRKYTLDEDYIVMCVSVAFCSSVESIFLFGDDSIYIYISSLCEGTQNMGWHSAIHSPPSVPILESKKTWELHFGDFFVNRVVVRPSQLGIHTKSWKVDMKQKSLSSF